MESKDRIIEIVKKMESLTEELRDLLPDDDLSKEKIIEKIGAIDKKEQEEI